MEKASFGTGTLLSYNEICLRRAKCLPFFLSFNYSKTCLKRPPHGAKESGRYRQVVS